MHLGIDGDIRRLAGDIEVVGMDVNALALQTVVERQGLMDLACDMQPHMAVDAAVVGIEIVAAPLVAGSHAGSAIGVLWVGGAEGAFLVGGGVVHLDREHVLLRAEMHRVRDVDAVGGDAVLVQTDLLAVEVDVARLAHAFELQEDAVAGKRGGQLEVLAIPGESLVGARVAAAVGDELAEAVDIVEAVRRGNGVHSASSKAGASAPGDILADELPVEVEVQRGARGLGRNVGCGRRRRGRGKHGIGAAQNHRKSQSKKAGGADKFAAGYFFGMTWDRTAFHDWDEIEDLAQERRGNPTIIHARTDRLLL